MKRTENIREETDNSSIQLYLQMVGMVGLTRYITILLCIRRNPLGGKLSQEDGGASAKLHSDRALVKNLFGRLKTVLGFHISPYQ